LNQVAYQRQAEWRHVKKFEAVLKIDEISTSDFL